MRLCPAFLVPQVRCQPKYVIRYPRYLSIVTVEVSQVFTHYSWYSSTLGSQETPIKLMYHILMRFFQKPLFNRCLPKITFPKVVVILAEDENESDQNGTSASLASAGNNVTGPVDNLDPTFVDYEG